MKILLGVNCAIFSQYLEHIFREALQNIQHRIFLNEEWLSKMRYAEDIIIFWQQLIRNGVISFNRPYGLEINTNRTK